MIGAQALIRTLVDSGVDVCFMNPGTSEMHFVSALDSVPQMRGVLTLFEGVATGAADGYARITDRPASTLLHLGPGLGNGLANLHNARRARSQIVNIVGAHATYHEKYDAPLQSDIETVARNVSEWICSSGSTAEIGRDAAEAVAIARTGQIATLVLPADVSWTEGGTPAAALVPSKPHPVDRQVIEQVAEATQAGASTLFLLGGVALREAGLVAASRIAAATGIRLLSQGHPARIQRGAGLPAISKIGYAAEVANHQMTGVTRLVLVGAKSPALFFGYPGVRSDLVPEGCAVDILAEPEDDVLAALEAVADLVAKDAAPVLAPLNPPPAPTGELTVASMAAAIGATLPENAIIVDESVTSSAGLPAATANSPRHDVIGLTGGAIGQGLPAALGVAIGAPGRPVLCVEADGSSMYTHQALWTMAQENLDVTTVLINNSAYAILRMELQRVGAATSGERARKMLDLPGIDHASIARGFGVDACTVRTADELVTALQRAYAEPGPHLIEAIVPPLA